MINKRGNCVGCGAINVWITKPSKMLCVKCNGKRLDSSKRVKETGERDLFLLIWQERPHVCTNCKCILHSPPRAYYFSHIEGKGAHNEKRLDANNIQLLCYDCHYAYDFRGKEAFNKRKK